jgi:hypothetical protein
MQFNIRANTLEIRAVQSLKCIVWRAVDCTCQGCYQVLVHTIKVSFVDDQGSEQFSEDSLRTLIDRHELNLRTYQHLGDRG